MLWPPVACASPTFTATARFACQRARVAAHRVIAAALRWSRRRRAFGGFASTAQGEPGATLGVGPLHRRSNFARAAVAGRIPHCADRQVASRLRHQVSSDELRLRRILWLHGRQRGLSRAHRGLRHAATGLLAESLVSRGYVIWLKSPAIDSSAALCCKRETVLFPLPPISTHFPSAASGAYNEGRSNRTKRKTRQSSAGGFYVRYLFGRSRPDSNRRSPA